MYMYHLFDQLLYNLNNYIEEYNKNNKFITVFTYFYFVL